MKTILVPVDFSNNAQRALGAAGVLARHTGARVFVLHAYQPYIPDVTSGISDLPIYEELEASFKKDLEGYVTTLREQGVDAEAIWVAEPVVPSVRSHTESLQADIVVMGRTGKGGFLDKLFGSVATDIVKESKVPVLVIPPQADPKAFKEVVYATQLEYEERDIIARVIDLNRSLGGRLTFLKINSITQPDIQIDEHYMAEIKDEFQLSDDDFVIREAGSVTDGIEKYADELRADLLIVSARARGFIEELLVDPSITKKLVLKTHIPLLVYHLDI